MNAQTVLLNETFEACAGTIVLNNTTQCGWRAAAFAGNNGNNRWEIRTSACQITGNRSLQITNAGTVCQYRANRAAATIAYYATPINATGYYCNTMTFDWKAVGEISGTTIYDYLMPFYSVDGTTWAPCGVELYGQATTQNVTVSLPSDCDNTTFYIGFYWENDGVSVANNPAAVVDNIVVTGYGPSAPANDNCANASTLTFSSGTATVAGTNQCATPDLMNSSCFNRNRNVWYKFTAASTNYYISLQTGTMSIPCMSVVSFPTACNATGATENTCFATLSTYANESACNLTIGNTYYVMVDNYYYGKPGTFTLTVQQSIPNDLSTTPGIINSCGTSFSSSTIGATSCGDCDPYGNDLDCRNASGSYSSGPALGDIGGDVGFSVENSSWYVFCSTTGSTTYTVTMMNTGGCTGSNGLQMAAFTGTPTNLALVAGGTPGMNVLNGGTFTSGGISLAANQCAYVVVDGYAGTNCNYSLNVAASPACVLPVEFLYFKGYHASKSNVLKWATATERNSQFFSVEKSADGSLFTQIGELKGSMNSVSQLNYTFTDKEPYEKGTYYRIKQVDTDGGFTFTNVIYINEKSQADKFEFVDVMPNPNNGRTAMNVMIPNKGVLTYIVYDLKGTKMKEEIMNVEEGSLQLEVDLNNLQDGVYFIRTSFDNEDFQAKYIIKNTKE